MYESNIIDINFLLLIYWIIYNLCMIRDYKFFFQINNIKILAKTKKI